MIIHFQLDPFLHECSIFVVLNGCIHPPCNRGVAVFSHVGSYNFPCFKDGYISLVFHLKYFLFSFVNIARSWVSRMTLVVCTSNLFQAIFLHVIRVFFTAFGTCLSSSTGFPLVSTFLAFEAPHGRWDALLDSLKKIAYLYLLRNMGLIRCQDVSIGLDSFFAFLMEILLIFVTPCLTRADAISSSGANANSPLLLITPLEVLSFSCE